MTDYDQVRLAAELAALPQQAANPTAQGMKLQNLVEWLIGEVPSCTIEMKNKHDAANTEEKDLWFKHFYPESRLPFSDELVPVECKNEGAPASADEVSRFGRKIEKSGGRDGLLVARSGLAGDIHKSAHAEITSQLNAGRRIVVVTAADFDGLANSDALVALLVKRHIELRTEQTYKTI